MRADLVCERKVSRTKKPFWNEKHGQGRTGRMVEAS